MPKKSAKEIELDLQFTIAILIVAAVKEIHEATGEYSGEMVCPRCNVGTLRWGVARSNKHARVMCDRKWTDEEGKEHSCVQAME